MEKTRFRGVLRISTGLYLVRWERRDPKTGRLRDRRKRVHAKSAEAAYQERTRLQDADGAAEVPRRTLSDFAVSWLNGKMPSLSPSTRSTYAQQLSHATSFVFRDGRCFGDFFVDAVEHDDVVAYREQQTDRPETINGRLRVLKTLFSDAVVTLTLPRNPTIRVKPLPAAAPRRERVLTPESLRALLEHMRQHDRDWYPLVLTLAVTGMRFSEATGLRWADIDYRAETVTVRRRNLRGTMREGTKGGGKIYRVLPLAPELGEVLAVHHRRIATSAKLAASGLVFPSETGGPYKGGSTAVVKPLRRASQGIELGRVVSAHDMRHTWNNILRQVTDDEVQMAITGHSTDEMREHYGHVSRAEKMAATRRGLRLITGT